MPMAAEDIVSMIKDALPGAEVEMRDLAGDNDHWTAKVVAPQFAGKTIKQTPTIHIPKDVKRAEVPLDPALAIMARFCELGA